MLRRASDETFVISGRFSQRRPATNDKRQRGKVFKNKVIRSPSKAADISHRLRGAAGMGVCGKEKEGKRRRGKYDTL